MPAPTEFRTTISTQRETRQAQVTSTDSDAPFGGFTARVLRYGPPADDYNTVWAPGVANEAMGERLPVLAWAHRWDAPIGRGVAWRDEADGLYVDFVFDDPDAVPLSKQARAQILSGTLTDVSVGFTRLADETNEDGSVTITKAVIDEVSCVLRGAVSGAQVVAGSARSAEEATVTLSTYSKVLKAMRDGDLSGPEAREALVLLLDAEDAEATESRAPLDADEDTTSLALGIDAALDAALACAAGVDVTAWPAECQQMWASVVAAETAVDALLEALGVADPDDADTEDATIVETPIMGTATAEEGETRALVDDREIADAIARAQRRSRR